MRKMLLISAAALALPAMALAQTSTDTGTLGKGTGTGAGASAMPGGTPNPPPNNAMQNSTIPPNGAMQNNTMQNGGSEATAGSTSAAKANPEGKISAQDRHFVHAAARAGLYEVEEGELAASKGDPAVKAVGNRMVTDHSWINEHLRSVARSNDISVPDDMTKGQEAQISHLKGLSSQSKFDKEYLKDQRHAHKQAIKLFKKEANSGSNQDIKIFAAKFVKTLQAHLRMIKSAQ